MCTEAVLEITGDCEPCAFIEGIRDGLRAQMEGKRGMLAFMEKGGAVKVGDAVTPLQRNRKSPKPNSPHSP